MKYHYIRCIHAVLIVSVCTLPNFKWYEKVCRVENGCRCLDYMSDSKCCCVGQSVVEIPLNLSDNVKRLSLYNVGIKRITEHSFERYRQLKEIVIEESSELTVIDASAFSLLQNLGKMMMSENGLVRMPTLQMTSQHRFALEVIDFSYNQIEYLGDGQLRAVHANKIRLNNNRLMEIGSHVFADCRFSLLELNDNLELKRLSIDTFADISLINRLDLSRTAISELPTNGLAKLEQLKLEDTEQLKKLPPILAFTSLKTVKFTYPYHCCLFRHASKEINAAGDQYTKNLEEIRNRECSAKSAMLKQQQLQQQMRPRRRRNVGLSPSIDDEKSESHESALDFSDLLHWFEEVNAGNITFEIEDDEHDSNLEFEFDANDVGRLISFNCTSSAVTDFFASIQCTPMPNALNPCEDIIGYTFLRRAIWFVWISAILGNVGVWIVLCHIRTKSMQVHYFFMANLSAADLLTGVYLGMLAIADLTTANEYYNSAVAWQTGIGCKIAGFISVFGSEISIMSIFLIAFDMCYNTRNAFYGKRLKMRTAFILMSIAYLIAIAMAILPIIGISSYSSTSICLPISIEDNIDRTYIIASLAVNLLVFLGMAISYVLIGIMLRNPVQPSRPEDNAIILKMAMLVVTEMICWFPTLFFGFTAAFGQPLISISVAKIFLVFFYPINAFTNPFLYVFLTKIVNKQMCPNGIKLLRSMPNERAISMFQHFYNSYSSSTHSRRKGEHKQVIVRRRSLTDMKKKFENYDVYRSLPVTGFRKEVVERAKIVPVSMKLPSNERFRISTAPEMSDIHELSGSEIISDLSPQYDTIIDNAAADRQSLLSKRTSIPSVGRDSGRGDSVGSRMSSQVDRFQVQTIIESR